MEMKHSRFYTKILFASLMFTLLFNIGGRTVYAQPRLASAADPRWRVLQYTNKARIREGLLSLSTNTQLGEVAGERAKEIFFLFDHTRPNGKAWFTALDEHGILYDFAGENIGKGYPDALAIVTDGWMQSESHRRVLLGTVYAHLGVGYFADINGKKYWVQTFAGMAECISSGRTECLVEDASEGKGIYRIGMPVEEMPLYIETSCMHGKGYIPVVSEITRGFDSSKGRHKFTVSVGGRDFEMTADFRHPFVDVGNEWYTEYVCRAYESEIMTGTKPDMFDPAGKITRGQFATTLYRIDHAEYDYQPRFPDVKAGVYYSEPVSWAADAGVVTGYGNGMFAPGNNITREQIAVMLYRYAKMKGYPVSGGVPLSSYKDSMAVSGYAKDAMVWAVGNGIITGKQNGTLLDPLGHASRAEASTMLVRFTEKYPT